MTSGQSSGPTGTGVQGRSSQQPASLHTHKEGPGLDQCAASQGTLFEGVGKPGEPALLSVRELGHLQQTSDSDVNRLPT